jgi:hypothetical protein
MPVGWALCGIGFAGLMAQARRLGPIGAAAPALALVGFAASQADSFTSIGRSPERGHFPGASMIPLADAAVEAVPPDERAAMFATLRVEAPLEWRYREKRPREPLPELRVRRFADDPEANRAAFNKWLESTKAESVVLLDISERSPFYFPEVLAYRQFRRLLAEQSRFTPVETRLLPDLGASVTVYRRAEAVAAPGRSPIVR